MHNINNATKFTANYISILKECLLIEIDSLGSPIFIPERVNKSNIIKLRDNLCDLWSIEESARESVKNVEGAFLQSAGYGLIDDFDLFLKVGYLLSDRVILWDLIYGRLLKDKNIDNIDYEDLGVKANNLISVTNLAQKGNLVILPQPIEWNEPSLKAFIEISKKVPITPSLLGLVSSHSIADELNLHPYTIAESESTYNKILKQHKAFYNEKDKINDKYLYESFLTGLLTTRLLNDIRFDEALRKPIKEFHNIVVERKEFYREFKSQLSSSGPIESEQNLKILSDNLKKNILSVNAKIRKSTDVYSKYGAAIAGILGLFSASGIATIPLGIVAAAIGLSSTLSAILNKKTDKSIITTVFNKLLK